LALLCFSAGLRANRGPNPPRKLGREAEWDDREGVEREWEEREQGIFL